MKIFFLESLISAQRFAAVWQEPGSLHQEEPIVGVLDDLPLRRTVLRPFEAKRLGNHAVESLEGLVIDVGSLRIFLLKGVGVSHR